MSNLVINMKDVKFGGNTLDVGNDNYGVIYNILKGEEDEISVDYYSEDLSNQYKNFFLDEILKCKKGNIHQDIFIITHYVEFCLLFA